MNMNELITDKFELLGTIIIPTHKDNLYELRSKKMYLFWIEPFASSLSI